MDSKNIKTFEMDIYSTVYTKRDLLLFYKEVDQLVDSIFKTDTDFSKSSSSILGKDKKQNVEEYLRANNIDFKNPVAIKETLLKIKKLGEAFPVVSLTLAFEPTEKILKDISFWFIKRLNTKVILDIDYERAFIGGALISYGGRYKDYSLREKIDKYFSSKYKI